jgi:hypothetical protein
MEGNHWRRLQLHLRRKRHLSESHAKKEPYAITAPQLPSQTKTIRFVPNNQPHVTRPHVLYTCIHHILQT